MDSPRVKLASRVKCRSRSDRWRSRVACRVYLCNVKCTKAIAYAYVACRVTLAWRSHPMCFRLECEMGQDIPACSSLNVRRTSSRLSLSVRWANSSLIFSVVWGGGPRVVASTAAFHTRVRGSVPGLGGLKETKNVSSPSTCESQYCGEPPWPRGSVLGLRPPGLEFRILCLEDSVISIISPSSGGSPGPV